MAYKYFRQKRKFKIAITLVKPQIRVRKAAPFRAGAKPYRVVAVGDTIISERGLVAIIGGDPRYEVCGAAHTFEEDRSGTTDCTDGMDARGGSRSDGRSTIPRAPVSGHLTLHLPAEARAR
jgi:hypothetical protein